MDLANSSRRLEERITIDDAITTKKRASKGLFCIRDLEMEGENVMKKLNYINSSLPGEGNE